MTTIADVNEGLRALGMRPTPPWLTRALDAHNRQRALVLQIHALTDRRTAVAALWLARAVAIASPRESGVTVAGVLEVVRKLAIAGAL